MTRDTLLFADEKKLSGATVRELEQAEAALKRLEQSGALTDARRYIEPSITWLEASLREIFQSEPTEWMRLEAGEAVLRAPVAAWRLRYPDRSLLLTFVDSLREIALDYGIEATPLHAGQRPGVAGRPGVVGAALSTTTLLRTIFHEYMQRMAADLALGRISEVFGLNNTELGSVFGVSRQAVDQWRTRGIPADRRGDVDRMRELAELYFQEFIPERIPQIVRRRVDALGGRTVLEALGADGPATVREYLARTFAFLAA